MVKTDDKPSLQEEFMDYCMFRLPDSTKTQTAADKYWHSVSEIKDLSGQNLHFPILTKLSLLLPMGMQTKRLLVMSG